MSQRDCPVEPDESDEVRALRALAGIAGWCVTSTTTGKHAENSYHKTAATNGRGRAVDLAARSGPSYDSEALLRINEQIIQLVPLSMIAELIYGGLGGICVKNGRIVDCHTVYPSVLAAHRNHVHLAVVKGFVYQGGPAMPADDPNTPNLPDIMGFYPVINTATGVCTGYYILAKDGELHAFGPGAQYYGRSEVVPR